ncbi:drug/metabolite transporter (DMT)-like permease [Stella humosa]|uniref:Drug/metabolite transporter (DMT)-like permease n=1 Tax=Stella humosa TaxID=94 RepID=A0A3N1L050_9PROT|nr:DMT family transporter [Stella humosa]ROP84310.1 drug/metabolite transporter (DMT)-like permease [Stella humosa]BBK33824.1 multidrug transporter [Stella humosa]
MTFPALAARWSGFAPTTRGLAWFILDQTFLVSTFVLIKWLGAHHSVLQIVFLRLAIGLVVLLPKIVQLGPTGLRTRRLGGHLMRNVCAIVGMYCSYLALTRLPLADATIVSFTGPMIMTILAVLLLGEKVRWRRWSAVLVGFSGVLLIAQPSAGTPLDALGIALFGTFVTCLSVATAKNLLRYEPAMQVTIWYTMLSLVLIAPFGIWAWQWPTAAEWPLFIGVGLLSTAGHYCFLRAYAEAEAGYLAGFGYVRLLFAIVIGYFVFDEVPGEWTLAGAAVILTSAVYIGWREAQLHRRAGPSRGGAPR